MKADSYFCLVAYRNSLRSPNLQSFSKKDLFILTQKELTNLRNESMQRLIDEGKERRVKLLFSHLTLSLYRFCYRHKVSLKNKWGCQSGGKSERRRMAPQWRIKSSVAEGEFCSSLVRRRNENGI